MQVDYGLILAAGFGTRMGEIGTVLPKPMWPIFEQTILELQIHYLSALGVKKIFINSHHQASHIHQFIQEKGLEKKVVLLHEKEILDIGGAIHNLAAQKNIHYSGNLLINNGDQFLFFDPKSLRNLFTYQPGSGVTLFSINVPKSMGHNEILIDSHFQLQGIRPNKEVKLSDLRTYSGMALIDLTKLTPSTGSSPFFQSIANFKQDKIYVRDLIDAEYVDFGTASRFYSQIVSIFAELLSAGQHSSRCLDFLKKNGCFNQSKINNQLQSYGPTSSKKTLNFGHTMVESLCSDSTIILDWPKKETFLKRGIYYNNISVEIPD